MAKAIPVEVMFIKTGKTVDMLLPIRQVLMAMAPSYQGDSTGKRITGMSIRAAMETIDYAEKAIGIKPEAAPMNALKLLESGVTDLIVWTNGVRVYR